MTTVLVVDDQALVRGGLTMIIDAQPDLHVVGEAADGREAIECVRRLRPDVVVMDIRMPNMDGVEATRRLAAPDLPAGQRARILILTTFDLDEYVVDALRAGASAFLLKDAPPAELIAAIRVVAAGDAVLAPARRASTTYSSRSNVVRTRILALCPAGRSGPARRRVASTPSIFGIRMSMTITSGRRRR
jgi:DNA-binding NarL/FixJ family response regulator